MQTIGGRAASAGGSLGRELLLRRLRLRPLPNAAAAAAVSGERGIVTSTSPSAHYLPYSALATGALTSASALASATLVPQHALRMHCAYYSTSSPDLGPSASTRRLSRKASERRRKKRGRRKGGGGGGSRRGGNKPIVQGGRGRPVRGGGGSNRLGLLPLPSADGSSDFDAFGADEYRYGDDMEDDDEDGAPHRLYYYLTPDEAGEGYDGGNDGPPSVRSRVESDPTYYHGMEGMALHWTTPSADPPSRDARVQAVMRDIFERQRLARKEKKGPSGGGEWDGRVIVRIPKVSADGDIDELDDEAVGTDDSDFVAVDSSDDGDEEIVEAEDEESPETEITKAASFDEKSPAEASVPSSGKSKATLSKVAERKLTELKKFKEEHGHLNVSQMGATKNLYQWLHRRKVQRDDFLAGKKVALTQEEFDRLNELGVDWSIGKQTKNPTP